MTANGPGDTARSTSIVWFRRDLRVHDHPALTAALERSEHVVPLFVFDTSLLRGRWPAPNRIHFMRESAAALDRALRARGSRLHVRIGRPAEVLPAVAAEARARDVFLTRDYGPYARQRDQAVVDALSRAGVDVHARQGLLVHEPEGLGVADGRPFSVFSPFRRAWEARPRREVLPAPSRVPTPDTVDPQELPDLRSLGVAPPAPMLPDPGEPAARERLERWIATGVDAYAERRNDLAVEGTSRLSQDLHWGLLSGLEVYERTRGPGRGREVFGGELVWREFYHHVLWHRPDVTEGPYQPRMTAVEHVDDPAAVDAWKEGRTGYPIVDAAMRQVRAMGWMHNRSRLIVASFLTKDLLQDYRVGERHFMQHLTDGDLASNNGNWQWTASTGTDPQPYFRIFNPVLQATRFDPDGAFVRRWLPELRDVPGRYVHEPWTMPVSVQGQVGCVIGRDYPAPIVDHAEARQRALDAYERARDAGEGVASGPAPVRRPAAAPRPRPQPRSRPPTR